MMKKESHKRLKQFDEWLDLVGAKRDALKFKSACDSLDSLRYCTFIGGRGCGKTELAKQLARRLLNSNYGLASADNWAQRYLYTTDKLYDTLGIKDYLNKVYGDPMLKFKNGNYISWDIDFANYDDDKLKELFKAPDIVDLVNQIKREEETNKMANDRQVYTFVTKDSASNHYEIRLEKDFKNNVYPYHVRIYTLKEILSTEKGSDNKCFTATFGYRYWEHLETQLMYDLINNGFSIRKDYRDNVTYELMRAKDKFSGRLYMNFDSPYQGGYTTNGAKTKPFETMPKIEKVIFNPPATIVKWKDGTKTIVKCQDGDEFDWEKGLAMAYVKRAFNNERTYYGLFKKNEPDVILHESL